MRFGFLCKLRGPRRKIRTYNAGLPKVYTAHFSQTPGLGKLNQELLHPRRAVRLVLGFVSIGLALGWSKGIGHWTFFPGFDYLDVTIGAIVGFYLVYAWLFEPLTVIKIDTQKLRH